MELRTGPATHRLGILAFANIVVTLLAGKHGWQDNTASEQAMILEGVRPYFETFRHGFLAHMTSLILVTDIVMRMIILQGQHPCGLCGPDLLLPRSLHAICASEAASL